MAFLDNGPEFQADAEKKDGAHPRFFTEARPNPARSATEGRPCFDEVEMVEILIPGDRLNSPVRIVNDELRARWPRAYAAFKSGQEEAIDGTPIDQLPGITKAEVEELKYFKVRSIEQLAGMPEGLLMKAFPMRGRALQDRAKRWIDATAGAAVEEKLAAENRRLLDMMAAMEKTVADLSSRLDAQAAAAIAAMPPGQG